MFLKIIWPEKLNLCGSISGSVQFYIGKIIFSKSKV